MDRLLTVIKIESGQLKEVNTGITNEVKLAVMVEMLKRKKEKIEAEMEFCDEPFHIEFEPEKGRVQFFFSLILCSETYIWCKLDGSDFVPDEGELQ